MSETIIGVLYLELNREMTNLRDLYQKVKPLHRCCCDGILCCEIQTKTVIVGKSVNIRCSTIKTECGVNARQ